MKLASLIMIVSLNAAIAATTYGQTVKLSLNMQNSTVAEVIDEIQRQSEFKFYYNSKMVDMDRIVTVKVRKGDVFDVLDKLFRKTSTGYKVVDRDIILTKREAGATEPLISVRQGITVTGTVTDTEGNPLPGASIAVQGTLSGAVADANGKFSITVPDDNAVLVFSFVGYATQEVTVGSQRDITVVLSEGEQIDEVVVVGYGVQKKASLTGSVATLNTAEIEGIPTSNLSNVLSGRIAGMRVTGSSGGRPGNTPDVAVRSAGSWNNTSPLYVIDGAVRDKFAFDGLNAADIDQISVLKDASAAIYGSRAANGVILVTTKRGHIGKPVITYTGSVGTGGVTMERKMMNAYELATWINDGLAWSGMDDSVPYWFTQDELDYYKTHTYDNREVIRRDPLITQHGINVSGGSERIRYFVAGNYYYESGIFDCTKFNKYDFRANVEGNITKDLVVSLGLSNEQRDDLRPSWQNDDGRTTLDDLWGLYNNYTMPFAPLYVDGYPVGGPPVDQMPIQELISTNTGYFRSKTTNTETNVALTWKVPFVKGLSVKVNFDKYIRQSFDKNFDTPNFKVWNLKYEGQHGHIVLPEMIGPDSYYLYNKTGDYLEERYTRNDSYQLNGIIDYHNSFGKHDVGATVIYEQSEGFDDWFWAQNKGFHDGFIDQIAAGGRDKNNYGVDGNANEVARQSVAGRFNYAYDSKYLLEVAFRYDGSTRFAPEHRWGFFPSVSAGWRISEESWFKNNISFINYLKLRASVGLLGNDNYGGDGWQWMKKWNWTSGTEYDNAVQGEAPNISYANRLLTWEKSLTQNYGFDAAILNNRLTAGFNYWTKHTTDILGARGGIVPSTFGANMPAENFGVMDSHGVEFELGWHDKIGDFSYRIGGNIAYATNKLVTMNEAENTPDWKKKTGLNPDRRLGFVYEGIVRTQDQLDALLATGYNFRGNAPYLGDAYYKNFRGDANVDDDDQTWIVDHIIPPVTYGFNIGASWKGFDLDLFFQGVSGNQNWYGYNKTSANNQAFWNDHWTPENTGARFPHAGILSDYPFNDANIGQSFWVFNGAFLRLKNVSLSYSLPKALLAKAKIGTIKVYVTATNLLLLQNHGALFDMDPEMGSSSDDGNVRNGYPPSRNYSLGVSISF